MSGWVTLDELVNELEEEAVTAADLPEAEALRLQRVLDASVYFVERIHRGRFNFNGALGSLLPVPNSDLVLGTLMLAKRWHTRRRSPQLLVSAGAAGQARVPGIDPDIERLLRIGRHAIPRVG
jgi:hypothetical protein